MRLRRSPFLFWLVAVALALVSGLTVTRLVGQAAARAARLGGLVEVPVTTRPVDAGEVLGSGDVTLRSLPADALPDGTPVESPAGRVVVVPLLTGEVVVAAKVAPEGLRGVAALVPAGWRALAVPVEQGGLALRTGHVVDVLATFDVASDPAAPQQADAGPPTFPVATGAKVVDVGTDSVTVAVIEEQAPRVAFALARGTVTLALAAP